MKNKISEGRTLDYIVTGEAVKSGNIVIVGDIAGIAVTDGAINETITVATGGVYTLPKSSGTISQGQKVYFNATDKNIIATDTENIFVGYAWNAATAADTVVNVKLPF